MAAMDPSARIYSRLLLRLYDFIVLTVSNSWAWRCPTGSTLLPFFQKHLGDNAHLDVGVGTGYYPAASAAKLTKLKNVTLLDLHPDTLAMAESRLRRAGYSGGVEKFNANVFSPVPESMHTKFDSISLFYVLHCLPGDMSTKADKVFTNLAVGLAPGGILYGATILGDNASHNWLGRLLMNVYNKKGIFGNRQDNIPDLEKSLRQHFDAVEIRRVGVVALFEARKRV